MNPPPTGVRTVPDCLLPVNTAPLTGLSYVAIVWEEVPIPAVI